MIQLGHLVGAVIGVLAFDAITGSLSGHRWGQDGWCGCSWCAVDPIDDAEHGEAGA